MIKTVQELPITSYSYPFTSALKHGALTEYGYVEREYLFSGTANVYRNDGAGNALVEYPDVPYTNRMVGRLSLIHIWCRGICPLFCPTGI